MRHLFSLALLLASSAAVAVMPGDRVDNFRLLDHEGNSHELYYHSDAEAIVLMVQGNGCPILRNALPALKSVRDEFASQDIRFLLINANIQDDRESIAAEAQRYDIDFPIMIDATQLISESLGVDRTSEVFVIDPDGWKVAYRGKIDDRLSYETQKPEADNHYLRNALSAMVDDESVETGYVEAGGCLINFPNREQDHASISYVDEIGPMLRDNCVTCHRNGGIGPFAMDEYRMVQGFAPMIREVMRTKRMPPWHADPHVGEWANARGLTISQKQKLVHWIEAGAPRDEGPDPLVEAAKKKWPEWELGEPDLVVELPPFDVPATGVIDYWNPRIENPLEEDVWVSAVDFLPGDREVVHHIIGFMEEPGEERRGFGASLGGYVPGGGPTIYPEDTGRLLDADTRFRLQVHYTTSGRETTDVTRMGIYFADTPPKYPLRGTVLMNWRIKIPPYAKAHTESASRVIDRDIMVYSLLPHAHYRGKSSEFRAIYPDGSEEVLLSVPHYNFNWQHTYDLAEPRILPAGTKIVHETTWDNSEQNPYNPDPSREVPWGEQSWDEMLFGSITFRVIGEETEEHQVAGTDD